MIEIDLRIEAMFVAEVTQAHFDRDADSSRTRFSLASRYLGFVRSKLSRSSSLTVLLWL